MAISTRKKNLIIAEWKAGKYKSYYAVAKAHKIDISTAKKILVNIEQSNIAIVDAGVMYESAKKSTKNLVEINAVETEVANRLKVYDITNTVLDGISKLVKGGKAQKVVTESLGEAGTSATVVEYDLQAKDYKDIQDAVDKASLTLGVNARHSQSQVNIQNNNQNNLKEDGFKITFVNKES